jgi:hypothetical protein
MSWCLLLIRCKNNLWPRKKQERKSRSATCLSDSKLRQKKNAIAVEPGKNLIRNLNIVLFALSFVLYFNSLSNGWALDDYGVIKESHLCNKAFPV